MGGGGGGTAEDLWKIGEKALKKTGPEHWVPQKKKAGGEAENYAEEPGDCGTP